MCFIDVNIRIKSFCPVIFSSDSASGWTPFGKELLLGVEDMLEKLKCLYINFISPFGVANMFVLVPGHCLLLL